ncbi:dynein light chain type 1 family protein [Carex rostrata]
MSEDSRRSGASVAALRSSDDRKSPSSTSSAASPAAVLAAPVALAPDPKITLKSADMKDEMRQEAFDCARAAFDKHTVEKEIAEYIKKEFDKRHGPTWHCIVGKNFGSYVTHETNFFVYFYINSKAVLLFKSG